MRSVAYEKDTLCLTATGMNFLAFKQPEYEFWDFHNNDVQLIALKEVVLQKLRHVSLACFSCHHIDSLSYSAIVYIPKSYVKPDLHSSATFWFDSKLSF